MTPRPRSSRHYRIRRAEPGLWATCRIMRRIPIPPSARRRCTKHGLPSAAVRMSRRKSPKSDTSIATRCTCRRIRWRLSREIVAKARDHVLERGGFGLAVDAFQLEPEGIHADVALRGIVTQRAARGERG